MIASDHQKIPLYGLTFSELGRLLDAWGLPPVHALPLWRGLYAGFVRDLAAIPGLPVKVRSRLESECSLTSAPVAAETPSADGFTRKFLLALADGQRIETVLMRFTGRVTACVSSQAGCAMGCVFCATGQMGFVRNLTAAEIVAQAVHVGRQLQTTGERLRNLVLMGMGEPLNNYEEVMRATEILRDSSGLSIGAKRISLSTVGIVPGIIRMAEEGSPLQLAVSLHGATDEERAALVPAGRRWPMDELMNACRYYQAKTGRRIFYEWTLIEGKNDSPDRARLLGHLLKGQSAQVNLIPLNPTIGYEGQPTDNSAVRAFQAVLRDEFGLPTTVRQRRGIDIAAGCGQLQAERRRKESALS
jgi:23S rRNA (adenine2503-C2)-methyltransferase